MVTMLQFYKTTRYLVVVTVVVYLVTTSKCIYIYTYLLTPWTRVLLEKLTGSATSQEIPRVLNLGIRFGLLTYLLHGKESFLRS